MALSDLPTELYMLIASHCDEKSLRSLENVDRTSRAVSIHEQLQRYGDQLAMLDPNVAYEYKKLTGNHLAPLKALQEDASYGLFKTTADKSAWKRGLAATLLVGFGPVALNTAFLTATKPGEIFSYLGDRTAMYTFLYGLYIAQLGSKGSLVDRVAVQMRHPAPGYPYVMVIGAALAYGAHMSLAYGLSHFSGGLGVLGQTALLCGIPSMQGGAYLGLEIDEERMPKTQEQKRQALHHLYTLRDHMHAFAESGSNHYTGRLCKLGINGDMPDNDGVTAAQKARAAGHTYAAESLEATERPRRPAQFVRRDERYNNYKYRLMMAGVCLWGVALGLGIGWLCATPAAKDSAVIPNGTTQTGDHRPH